ncbi:unnamed protein product [Adineta ricciae]|uniref:Peptidase S1 domain-containing protein n=1 Tax=Adineta ricciae TaxID=249248 RepID=A0A814KCS0_ADIRI|nr:unnamed protein product [Adineta ricciae]
MKIFFVGLLLSFIGTNLCQKHQTRIFGGSEPPINTFPWMVSVRIDALSSLTHICGGALISDSFVLTSVSCLQATLILPSILSVKAGIHRAFNDTDENAQLRRVTQVITHPNYTATNLLNDLALVMVDKPFNIKGISVSTITLSNQTNLKDFELIAIGWGFMENTTNTTKPPLSMQQVIVRENVECTNEIAANPKTQLCAAGACRGDGGGPLMIHSEGVQQYELVGVISARFSCTSRGIYTRIAPFIDWIFNTMKNPPPPPTFPPIIVIPTIALSTPKPDVLGPPIPFPCNTSYTCGCSSIPVVFHDEPPFPNTTHGRNQGRIVGGENAQPYSWPWVVSIRSQLNTHFCGGSLLNEEWVLTAAHCITNATGIKVHIGVHNLTHPSLQILEVAQRIVHPYYNVSARYFNDIALLRLAQLADLTTAAKHAGITCRPPITAGVDHPQVGTPLAVIGWGQLLSNGIRPQVLRQVRVKTIANDDRRCLNSKTHKERQFCAMVDGGQKDSCQGDSGGPIHQWLGDHWEQVGIVSFGTGCGEAEHPGVYTRLSFYHDWIDAIMKGLNYTTPNVPITTTRTSTDCLTCMEGSGNHGITTLSLSNFTGSISIIESRADDDQFMLSSPPANATGHLFSSNQHFKLITQPILGARSRKKDKFESIITSRRSSYDDSPPLIFPVHRVEKSQHESTDSGIDLSSSTNSSVQYPQQQYFSYYRPLSALNEDVNTTDQKNDIYEQKRGSTSSSDARSNSDTYFKTLKTSKAELPYPLTQQHRALNDLTTRILPTTQTPIQKANPSSLKPLRKSTKLNIIVQPSIPSTRPEPIQSVTRTTSSSSRQTFKTKAVTPLGHYRNPEQIRAHINRSVIDRQQPSHVLKRGTIRQKVIPLDIPASKINTLLTKQSNQSKIIIHSKTNENSTVQHLCVPQPRQTKPTLPLLHHDEVLPEKTQKDKERMNDKHKISNKIFRSRPTPESFKTQQKKENTFRHAQERHWPMNPKRPVVAPVKIQPLPKIPVRPRQKSSEEILVNLLRSTPDGEIHPKRQKLDSSSLQGNLTYRLSTENNQRLPLKDITPIDNDSSSSLSIVSPFHNLPSISTKYQKEHATPSSSVDKSSFSINKLIVPKREEDDLSMNYDSDDGWSNDSIEIIYIDEQYLTQKKKTTPPPSSSSRFIFKPNAPLHQQKILLH